MPKTIDSSPAGMGDLLVGLWIAEAARAAGEEVPLVEEGRSEIVRAFGHHTTGSRSDDCMVLGSGSSTYEEEIRTAGSDRSLRVERWQRTVGWDFGWRRPVLRALSDETLGWAHAMTGDGPSVVFAPRAAFGTRSAPIQKWLRTAWSLHNEGIRTVAIDGSKDVVDAFPHFAYGFGWQHVMALLSRATVVAGNDSGIAHLSSTIGTPTVAAMGPTDPGIVFGHCLDVLRPVLSASVECVSCHFQGSRGFQAACDHGCDALHTIPWTALRAKILEAIESRTSIAVR